ncbi:MAG: hypothetical protein JWO94_225 [Verrucomicrobiaceae bacterium]|nr:hypothetical protein [Verrucomicrobiaceae bacterium]
MAQVVYSPDALDDLRDIWDYVANDSAYQADRLLNRFRTKNRTFGETEYARAFAS